PRRRRAPRELHELRLLFAAAILPAALARKLQQKEARKGPQAGFWKSVVASPGWTRNSEDGKSQAESVSGRTEPKAMSGPPGSGVRHRQIPAPARSASRQRVSAAPSEYSGEFGSLPGSSPSQSGCRRSARSSS